jgi:hypothetical protein
MDLQGSAWCNANGWIHPIVRGSAGVSPTLVLNPRHDIDFVERAEAIVSRGVDSPRALEESLREHYPRVVVRARELNGEPFTIWYVYRDGHWIPGIPEDPKGG